MRLPWFLRIKEWNYSINNYICGCALLFKQRTIQNGGIPCHSDRKLFEYLLLEAMSAGLSWKLMFQKREIFRACFVDFDYNKVAGFTDSDINAAMEHQGIIRSRREIEVIVTNAQAFIRIIEEFGSFETYLWKYTNGQTYIYHRHLDCEWITKKWIVGCHRHRPKEAWLQVPWFDTHLLIPSEHRYD